MNTEYQVIFDKFIRKLKNDSTFMKYKGLTDIEIDQMVDEHSVSLLGRSVDRIYEYGLPDVDFYDRNDTLKTFNFSLIPQEIALLSDLMQLCYYEEDKNKLKVIEWNFRSNEVEVFSPANNRDSFLKMIKDMEIRIVNSITNYLSRERDTWKLKSIYDGGSV